MALVWVGCPPDPGGRLPSSQIEPSTIQYCNHQVHGEFLITLYKYLILKPNLPERGYTYVKNGKRDLKKPSKDRSWRCQQQVTPKRQQHS
jgi:hypothetical protein